MWSRETWKAGRWQAVKVIDSEITYFTNNKEALKLTVYNENFDTRKFLIFTSNIDLINELLEVTYGTCNVESANEKDFIGLEFLVWLEERNGYLNITKIGLPEDSL